MFDPIDFDPVLAGLWPPGASVVAPYGSGADGDVDAAVRSLWLETKALAAPSPVEELQTLLNEMTTEMRQQFEAFRRIRVDAEAKLADGDEAELKLAKADIKSANDALSLLVRTIEKIDSLQRSLANDREMAAERAFSPEAYRALLDTVRARIEQRAAELAVTNRAGAGGTHDNSSGANSVVATAPAEIGTGDTGPP